MEIEEGSASTGGNRGPRLIALLIVYTIDSSTSFVFFLLPICSFFVFSPSFFLFPSLFCALFLSFSVTVASMDSANFIDSQMSRVVAFIVEVERCIDGCNKKQNDCNEAQLQTLFICYFMQSELMQVCKKNSSVSA